MKNGDSKFAGIYAAFRVPEMVVAPTQTIAVGASGTAVTSIAAFAGAGEKSFYETDKTKLGTWSDMSSVALTSAALITGNTAPYGKAIGACVKAGLSMANSNATPYKSCWSMVSTIMVGTDNKMTNVANRILLCSDQAANAQNDYTDAGNVTDAADKTAKFFKYDRDLILATLYQSNGDSNTSGETWCSGTWLRQPDVGTKETLLGQKGFGPKGKCTW